MSIELEYRTLIRLIKERLVVLGMSQSKLARTIGISPAAVCQILNHKKYPTLLTSLNLLQAVGLVVTYEIKERVNGKKKAKK